MELPRGGDDHATRPAPAPVLPIFGGASDFKTMDGGAYPGDPGPPSSEIPIKPAAVTGTYATYPRLDGTRTIPRLGRGGALAPVRHREPFAPLRVPRGSRTSLERDTHQTRSRYGDLRYLPTIGWNAYDS